uniref:Uncharacterized protein n=1 Tax=Arundo donax TaxID=35708 RepID=A0A0A9CC95_ARUDO
MRVAPSGPCP